MKPRELFSTLALVTVLSLMGCTGPNKEIITKQREGRSYPVPYSTAFQTVIFTLTKKGIAIDTIDKENGFITTRPQQTREEKYVYQIAVRPVGTSETLISVMCNWSVSPGIDVAYAGIPSTIAKSKSGDLEIELADDIQKEMAKESIPSATQSR
jgi:preprotein translocase subunit YajC